MIDGEDDGLALTEELEQPEEGAEQQAPDADDDGELHIEIEGEEEAEETPLIKKLRTELRESQKREADARKATAPAEIVVPPEPDLWDDCEGDPDKYKAALREHDKLVQAAEAQKQAATQQSQISTQAFERARAVYHAKAETLGVQNFKASEDAVCAALPIVTQSAIVQYIKDPEKLVYALGKNPTALARVEAETDPVRQILMLHDMAKGINVTRKKPPPPEAETIQRGSAPLSATKDKRLEQLEKAASASNDRSAVIAYKASLKAKQA